MRAQVGKQWVDSFADCAGCGLRQVDGNARPAAERVIEKFRVLGAESEFMQTIARSTPKN